VIAETSGDVDICTLCRDDATLLEFGLRWLLMSVHFLSGRMVMEVSTKVEEEIYSGI